MRIRKFSRKYKLFLYTNVFRKLRKSLVIATFVLNTLSIQTVNISEIRKIFRTICHQTSRISCYACNLSRNTVKNRELVSGILGYIVRIPS